MSAVDKKGQTVLHFAAHNSDVSVVNLLVDSGADVNVRDNKKRTPLHIAADHNASANVITALVECGADVDAVSTW